MRPSRTLTALALAAATAITTTAVAVAADVAVVAPSGAAAQENPEGLAVAADGTIYVTQGLPFFVGPSDGWVKAIGPDGDVSTLIHWPGGQGPAGVVVDGDGDLYVARPDPMAEASRGVYRVDTDGNSERLPGTEAILMANGLALDDAGSLYASDSALGTVWRFPLDGSAAPEAWLSHPTLTGCAEGDVGVNGNSASWFGSILTRARSRSWPRPTTGCTIRPAPPSVRGSAMVSTSRTSQSCPRRPTRGSVRRSSCFRDACSPGSASAGPGGYPPRMPDVLLEARGLSKTFRSGRGSSRREVRAVQDVDLAIEPGQTHGLVGESGSGKSTIGRVLLRLVEPDAGTVTFRGQDLFALEGADLRAMRRHMQLIYQDPYSSVDPRFRVRDVVAEPWVIHRLYDRAERRRRAEELLERVGIDPALGDRRPSSFSGGQLQRIGIARALALEPELIICDEPVSALDVSVQGQIINLLMDLQAERGISYLFIAHDLAVVRHISQRVSVMRQGRIVESGPRDEVFERPRHDYTRQLLAAMGAEPVAG